MLRSDEDCIQNKAGGTWRRYEVSAVWQSLNGTTCSVDSPIACLLLDKLRSAGVVPILRAGYSALSAGTWIRPHFGPSNAQLKIHLGLSGCEECAKMRVGDSAWRPWVQGEPVVFDDSFEHEVINECLSERVVFQVRSPCYNEFRSTFPVARYRAASVAVLILLVCELAFFRWSFATQNYSGKTQQRIDLWCWMLTDFVALLSSTCTAVAVYSSIIHNYSSTQATYSYM